MTVITVANTMIAPPILILTGRVLLLSWGKCERSTLTPDRSSLLSALLVAGLAVILMAPRAAANCTDCHVTLKQDPAWDHSYREWESSKHAAHDVSCVNCHGGDSEAEFAEDAHIHVDFSGRTEAEHALRRLALVQGCGNCHHRERASFRRSPHQNALEAGQVAADCTTCHGVLGTRVVDTLTIADRCQECHQGERLGVAVGVAETLLEHFHQVRTALDLPEPGQRLQAEQQKEVESSIVTAMDALHELNLEAVGLGPLDEPPHCTACHMTLRPDPTSAHSYLEWEDSLHASFEISCVNCHGGDSEAEVAEKAHVDMGFLGAGSLKGTADRLVLAEGCGNCHENEIAGYRASPHYQALKSGKNAADCTTCHGAVGSYVLTPETITATCRQCHTSETPGTTVGVAQTLLEYTRRVRMALVFPEPGQRLSGEEREQVEEAITAAMAAWHEFDLEAVGLALAHGTGVIER